MVVVPFFPEEVSPEGIVIGPPVESPICQKVILTVDYALTVEEASELTPCNVIGHAVTSDIFSFEAMQKPKGKATGEFILRFFAQATTEEMKMYGMQNGWAVGSLSELQKISQILPGLQKYYRIVAPGSVGNDRGIEVIPFLYRTPNHNGILDVDPVYTHWVDTYCVYRL